MLPSARPPRRAPTYRAAAGHGAEQPRSSEGRTCARRAGAEWALRYARRRDRHARALDVLGRVGDSREIVELAAAAGLLARSRSPTMTGSQATRSRKRARRESLGNQLRARLRGLLRASRPARCTSSATSSSRAKDPCRPNSPACARTGRRRNEQTRARLKGSRPSRQFRRGPGWSPAALSSAGHISPPSSSPTARPRASRTPSHAVLAKGLRDMSPRPASKPRALSPPARGSGAVTVLAHPFSLGVETSELDGVLGELAEAGLVGPRVLLRPLLARGTDLACGDGQEPRPRRDRGLGLPRHFQARPLIGIGTGDLEVPDEALVEPGGPQARPGLTRRRRPNLTAIDPARVFTAHADAWQAQGAALHPLRRRRGELPGWRLMASGLPYSYLNAACVTDPALADPGLPGPGTGTAASPGEPSPPRAPDWPHGRRLLTQDLMALEPASLSPARGLPASPCAVRGPRTLRGRRHRQRRFRLSRRSRPCMARTALCLRRRRGRPRGARRRCRWRPGYATMRR